MCEIGFRGKRLRAIAKDLGSSTFAEILMMAGDLIDC